MIMGVAVRLLMPQMKHFDAILKLMVYKTRSKELGQG